MDKIESKSGSPLLKDFMASIVVFLTAVPLCMGISLASGAPVEAGFISGVVGGLVVSIISGSPLQVSGPAAGLSILMLEFIQMHGFSALGPVIIIAAAIQVVAGMLRFGQLFRAVSPAVVQGMLSGIGLLIIVGQFQVMIGNSPAASGIQNILAVPSAIQSLLANARNAPDSHSSLVSGIVGLATISIMLLWSKFATGRIRFLPGALIAIVSISALATWKQLPVKYVCVPSNFLTAIHFPDWVAASKLGTGEVLENAFVLALIASAETLLSAGAVDKLHNGPRCKYDKELLAQGIGNAICGFLGALPITGVIARSSVNVYAGARTRCSAFLHGMWLLLFVALLPELLKMVPIPCLAGLLMVTGFKLIDKNGVKKLWSYGPRLVVIYAATVICIVSTDLLTGVMLGIALSILKLIYTMSKLEIVQTVDAVHKRVQLQLYGSATFISLPRLANVLEQLPADCELHVCLENLDYVDHACLELLMDWKSQKEATGGALIMDWGELQAAFRYKSRRTRKGALLQIAGRPAEDYEPIGPLSAS